MSKKKHRTPWLDDEAEAPMVHEYAEKLGGFMDAMADGKIEKHELAEQEDRVVALMKKIEPALPDDLHEDVTRLLCELSAYNIMHTIHGLFEAAPRKTEFEW